MHKGNADVKRGVMASEPSQATDAQVTLMLRSHGPLTRLGLVEATGLSLATINRAIARLAAAGVVVPAGRNLSTGGRPPERYAYNGAGRTVAGISVTEQGATGLVLSLGGQIVGRHAVAFTRADSPETRLESTLALLDGVLAGAHGAGRLSGVGVAVPGVVGPQGTVSAIHELGWDRLALGALLSRRAGMPVALDNDANALAVGEHLRGAGRGVDNLVALMVTTGLGAGLITNGQLYRGLHHEAGEIGYLLTERGSLRRHFPHRGDLEQRAGADRLAAEAVRLGLPDGARATLPHLIGAGLGGLGVGGPARELAEELLDLTALAVAGMCVVLDPELVIIGGGDDESDMAAVITGVRERLLGRILRVPRIEAAALGRDAIMIGAAVIAGAGASQA
jgi:predicted NBD/HSP70 family sugar kinase